MRTDCVTGKNVERVGKLAEDVQLARKLLRQVEAHNLHGKLIGQASGSSV
jgi:hypothetical protein